jgi:hypothetical protein
MWHCVGVGGQAVKITGHCVDTGGHLVVTAGHSVSMI